MAAKRVGLRAKMIRLFALQVLLISLATLFGIYLSNSIVQDVLMRTALEGEAKHYWRLYESNPAQPLPNTDNMLGYLARDGVVAGIPMDVLEAAPEPGYHRAVVADEEQIVHVSDRGNARLFLVFRSDRVSDLALFFGIFPLSIVLLIMYALLLFTYRQSQQAVSPVVRLAKYLDEFEFGRQHTSALDLSGLRDLQDTEVAVMIDAIDEFTDRLDAFIERERFFTRDASHELRTPVAVFKASLDLMQRDKDRPKRDVDALARMRRTINDMEGLIETMLVLASEEQLQASNDLVLVNKVVLGQADSLQPLAVRVGNEIVVAESAQLRVHAPEKVVQIIVTNLLRNAINYTRDGRIEISVSADSVRVSDSGVGMTESEVKAAFEPFFRSEKAREKSSGHGLGLAIVRRLVDQYNWSVDVNSEPDVGTEVIVRFLRRGRH